MRSVLLLISLFVSLSAGAFSLSEEIRQLNKDFGKVLPYPILIFDKDEVREFLRRQNVLDSGDDKRIAAQLAIYVRQKFNFELTEGQAHNLAPYLTILNSAASALPLFEGYQSNVAPTACVVMPNGENLNHREELKRILGVSPGVNPYGNLDFSRLEKLMSLEEIKLFSLYHELSHCLDQFFTPALHASEPEPHQIHLAESFAEINAVFLLSQRKELKHIAAARVVLRGLYSKYFGPYLAKHPPTMAGAAYNKGGSIYFLSPQLVIAQSQLDNFDLNVQNMNLKQTLSLSRRMVESHAIHFRSFPALHVLFQEGSDAAQSKYKEMARNHPTLFQRAYFDLLSWSSFLAHVEDFLPPSE